jgi:predicted transcriptional regulator
MQTVKEQVIEIIKNMPDETTLDDILYSLYVMKKVEDGLEDAKNGKVVSHQEARTIVLKNGI